MNSFDKKPNVRPPKEPTGEGRLRPRLKDASRRALQARRSLEKKEEPLRDHQKSKQKLTREFVLARAMFWTGKDSSLEKVRSLVLRECELYTFESTDSFKLHELAAIELLSLSHNFISVLQPLSELDSLQELNLNNNRVYEVEALAALQKLTRLYLSNNKVRNVAPLGKLPALQLLHLYSNEVPYAEKEVMLGVAANLTELDIERNDVFREDEKGQWMLDKMRKLNGEALSVREKELQSSKLLSSKGFMSATQSGWRSGSTLFRPATACSQLMEDEPQNQLEPVTETQQNYLDIQANLQEAENQYLRLDDDYEEQIVRNVKLKSELHRKLQLQRQTEQEQERLQEKREKCEQLRRTVASMKENVFGRSNNPLLQRLYEVTMQVEMKRISQQFPSVEPPKTPVVEPRKLELPQRPFDADEEIEFSDEEPPMPINDQEYIQRLLNDNDDTIEQLRRELRELS